MQEVDALGECPKNKCFPDSKLRGKKPVVVRVWRGYL